MLTRFLFDEPTTIGGFFGRTLLWLPLAFLFWIVFAPVLHFPIAIVMNVLSWVGIPTWLLAVDQAPQTFTFITSLRPPSAEGFSATARVTTDVNALLYTFGLPLFIALTMASAQAGRTKRLFVGYLMLLPFLIVAVYVTGLKQISLGSDGGVAKQMEFSVLQNTLVAFGYQFSTLIMPPVTAFAVWLFTHRAFVERFARGALRPLRRISA
jgi:hypothetical protein